MRPRKRNRVNMRTIILALIKQKADISLLTHPDIPSFVVLNQIEPGIQTATNMIHTKLVLALNRLSNELLQNSIVR